MSYRKPLILSACLLTSIAIPAGGQWISPPGSNTYTFDKVGIGTTTPITDLHVLSNQAGGVSSATGMRIENLNPAPTGERTVVLSLKNNHSSSPQDWLMSVIGNSPGRSGNFEIRQIGPGVSNVNRLTINPVGNVGLGTTAPGQQLTITGCLRFDNAGTTNADVDLCNDDATYGNTGVTLRTRSNPSNGLPIFRVLSSGGAARLQVEHNGRLYTANRLFVAGTGDSYIAGNLGLGVTNPAEKLEVDGTVKAREVVVTQQGWPDFVFEEGYALQPLSELEAEIAEIGHLPGIPSAAEVEANGIGIGEMQAKLLQKVEELTLHMIALEKENVALRSRLDILASAPTVTITGATR